MFMLMCLLLLHCSESSVDNENVGHSKCLSLLVIYEDLLLVQRLLKYGASFAKRMIVHSPISELFASCSRDPFGTDSCMINAGCIPLATGGVCLIPNISVLKKDLKENLQIALENSSLTVKTPEKYCGNLKVSMSLFHLPVVCGHALKQHRKLINCRDFLIMLQLVLYTPLRYAHYNTFLKPSPFIPVVKACYCLMPSFLFTVRYDFQVLA
ncbi:minichromosome maintenance domain-containing protein 2-like [Acropora millepora]|uniref:minichromosome maintenance domain-containing protein 2-like n=1 Tax=Acropora millepora TaxID=45264 RepID=UPI001CF3BA28|nr:minichromosome maintenance domain-containing protein 2-like [Acropora millepora]